MFELKPIARHMVLACGGIAGALLVAQPASAQQAQPQAQKLERIEITGSNIRRTDTETVAPVEIITREDIQRTGKATVAEVLRSIPANSGGSFSETFSNSFAPGASGISLRGLGQKATLVLINGRRTSGYGFAQNIQDTFVDLNSIPTSAVERIEILKDGASAIYGSDAIAGVVNIILRKDFRGLTAGADVGFFEGKSDYRATVTGGFGDLGSDKFNVFGVLDYYKRDLVQLSDTEFGKTRDFRGTDGGRNFTSLQGAGTWTGVPGSANANQRQAITDCAANGGTVLTSAQAVAQGLILSGSATDLPGNTFCSKDFNSSFTAIPSTDRVGLLLRGTAEFTPNIQGFAEFGYSQVKSEQKFQEPFFAGTTGLQQTPAGLRPFTYNVTFAPGVAGNPLGTNARYSGVLRDFGTRDTDIKSDTMRALGGLRYNVWGWDAESAVTWSQNEVTATSLNRLNIAGTSAALGVTTAPQPPTPISTSSSYNLDRPGANSDAVRNQMRINFDRKATSELQAIDTRAFREIGQLPGGAIGLAVGAEYRKETLKDKPDPRAQGGQVLGQGIVATDGSRDSTALFVETSLPLTKTLEAQLALRNDNYSDFGNALTPKAGLKFRPTSEWLFRFNWGKGFRAPTLPEITPSVATFFTQVNDPFTAQTGVQISGVFAGNPNLEAEDSRSTTFGFVFEPTNNTNISFDWYDIKWQNIVNADSFQAIVNADSASRLGGGPGDPRVIRDLTNPIAVGGRTAFPVVTVLNNYRNFSSQTTNGFDVDFRHRIPTSYGRFSTRLNTSYINSFKVEGTEYADGNGFNTIPRWRGFISLDWEQGAYLVTGRVNYIDSYDQQLLGGSFFTNQDPRFQTGRYPIRVPSYTTLDLFGRWNINAKLTVTASINNVTDEKPPYDPGFSSTFLYDFSQYSPFGRTYRVGASYKFW
jgi:iron complex outermembrane receptor protein